jgi:hypothetical protein
MFEPNLSSLASVPCSADKVPLVQHGFKNARRANWQSPLVGVPTGQVNGIDVLDIDPEGRSWFDQNFASLPKTQAHETQRGLHLLFKHAPGLRCSAGRIAAGVDVRADGGYVIWWPREGLPVEDAPLAEWPDWLLEEAKGKRRTRVDPRTYSPRGVVRDAEDVCAALTQLDPRDFAEGAEGEEKRARWIALMNGAKAAGVPLEVFCEWSGGQDRYERNDDEIARNWQSLRAEHPGAFYAELWAAGIRLNHRMEGAERPRVHPGIPRTINFYGRTESARRPLQRAGGELREPALFNAACVMAEMVGEKRMAPKVAVGLLESDCQTNGLWKEDKALCLRTIGRAFRHVEEKLLGEGT